MEGRKKEIEEKHYEEIISGLLKLKGCFNRDIWLYKGAYYGALRLSGVIRMDMHQYQRNFSTILIASFPKTGFTWLKSLVFAIMNRTRYEKDAHPLLTKISHDLIPLLERMDTDYTSFENAIEPLLVSTHVRYTALPDSLIHSASKVVYICRDPKDVFVSYYHFAYKLFPKSALSEVDRLSNDFSLFCEGLCHNGPFWDHVLSYWKASIEKPARVMFLRYEDIKSQPQFNVKKIAEFLGHSFTFEEEENGEVEHIVNLCSFESLSNLEVNKTGATDIMKYDAFYRKGQVGDWKHYLTPEMADRIDTITKRKLHGSGLTF